MLVVFRGVLLQRPRLMFICIHRALHDEPQYCVRTDTLISLRVLRGLPNGHGAHLHGIASLSLREDRRAGKDNKGA